MQSKISLGLDSETLAAGYERESAARQFRSGQDLIEALQIARGERILDVGTGTGLLAAYVADLVGPGGSVIGIDPLALRIEIAKGKQKPNLQFAVGDAQDLTPFEPASFDVVYLNSVFHWLPDQAAALQQIARVLKRGGRLGIATGSGDHPFPIQAMKAQIMSREPYCGFQEKAMGVARNLKQEELSAVLDRTGFDADIKLHSSFAVAADPEAMIDFFEASAFGNFLGNLPDALRGPARHEVAEALEALRTDEGIRMEQIRLMAVAVKR
jgi:arsenite methyltransferase